MFKNDFLKESYSLRNIFISGMFCSLILGGSIFSLAVLDGFSPRYHVPYIFTATEFKFTIACCFVSYILAASLVYYLKDSLQKFVDSWLIVSFSGSVMFSVLLEAISKIV